MANKKKGALPASLQDLSGASFVAQPDIITIPGSAEPSDNSAANWEQIKKHLTGNPIPLPYITVSPDDAQAESGKPPANDFKFNWNVTTPETTNSAPDLVTVEALKATLKKPLDFDPNFIVPAVDVGSLNLGHYQKPNVTTPSDGINPVKTAKNLKSPNADFLNGILPHGNEKPHNNKTATKSDVLASVKEALKAPPQEASADFNRKPLGISAIDTKSIKLL